MRTTLAILISVLMPLIGSTDAAVGKDAAQARISDFFGTYIGRSDRTIVKGMAARDASVTIKPSGKTGFNVSWKTVIRRSDRKPKVTSYSIDFRPRPKRPHLYASAMQKNLFGHMTPLDPLAGNPYVWAGLKDKTLTVWALFILDDGGYELQIYKRSLIPTGLQLQFERVRNGKTMKLITATLKKTGK